MNTWPKHVICGINPVYRLSELEPLRVKLERIVLSNSRSTDKNTDVQYFTRDNATKPRTAGGACRLFLVGLVGEARLLNGLSHPGTRQAAAGDERLEDINDHCDTDKKSPEA
jgi:hypothetical protein